MSLTPPDFLNEEAHMTPGDIGKQLSDALDLLHKMGTFQTELRQHLDTLSTHDWTNGIDNLQNLQNKLQEKITVFDSAICMKRASVIVNKRKRKRLVAKRRRQELKAAKESESTRRFAMHKEIDSLLKLIEDKNKIELQKKLVCKESTAVLSNVKSRIAEAHRWLNIIQPLLELRTLRSKAAIARGEKIESSHEGTFSQIMQKLKTIWEVTLERYKTEERDLNNILINHYKKHSNELELFEEWNYVIFGEKKLNKANNIEDSFGIESFIAIRKCWDQFITDYRDPDGSKIPIGCVIPAEPSSAPWKEYLVENS